MNANGKRDKRYHLEEIGDRKWVLTCEGTSEKWKVNHPWTAIDIVGSRRDGEIVEVLTLTDKGIRAAG